MVLEKVIGAIVMMENRGLMEMIEDAVMVMAMGVVIGFDAVFIRVLEPLLV